MFKIISAEFKKILSKPGIYVLSLLLAVILVLGVFIYNPQVQESKKITFTQTNFLDKYRYAINQNSDKKGTKISSYAKLLKYSRLQSDCGNMTTFYYFCTPKNLRI